MDNILAPLEEYTEKNPQEVLIVHAQENEEKVEIMIFRGFSSCLTGATEFDPDLPILSSHAQIIALDRLKAPFTPANPQYIQQNISLTDFNN
ncbi:MAG: hypothetical protein IGQ45_08290 [Cyanobacterium sp. T60_A2020_053]|nr:hypothetical protein [Cyanobacterium sp. T60_A2020_053]